MNTQTSFDLQRIAKALEEILKELKNKR